MILEIIAQILAAYTSEPLEGATMEAVFVI